MQEWKPLNPPAPPEPPSSPVQEGPHRWRQTFRGLPVQTPEGRGPFNIPADLADDIAAHVEQVGFVHVDEVRALLVAAGLPADLEGLPWQTRHQHPPEQGPDTWTNPPRWVDQEESTDG